MTSLFRKISEFGITSETTSEQAYHYRLTNVLLLLMFFASIMETTMLFLSRAWSAGLANSTAPIVFATGLWLMKTGRTVAARMFVLIISFTVGYAMVASLGPESYFQFIFLFASAFSLVFFSSGEPYLRFVGMAIPFIAFIILEITNYQPVFLPRTEISPQAYAVMRVVTVLIIWSLMVTHFGYFVRGRKKLEEQLISSAKMVAMGRMAAGIAHEVNNPLQTIVSNAERLKTNADAGTLDPRKVSESANQMVNVSMRIAGIVKGLLALSRDSSVDTMRNVDINDIVDTALSFCNSQFEASKIRIDFEQSPNPVAVRGRGPQLSEVVLNVLNNAFDAVQESQDKWVQIKLGYDKTNAIIAISNSGPLIDPKMSHKIFDPFFTTKPVGKGTGLGLSICQNILASHGGTIALDSSSPTTRFLIQLPLSS